MHPSPWDCPDFVMVRLGNGSYGLPVRDGDASSAASAIEIMYCPWCGSPLPGHRSRRPTKADREAGREAWETRIRSQDLAVRAAIGRYEGRVASLSENGATVGYLCAVDTTRAALRARWWRRGKPEEPALGWLIEWTDPSRAQNGYTDEFGDVEAYDVLDQVREWERGRHARAGEVLALGWLDASEAAEIAARFGWPPPPAA